MLNLRPKAARDDEPDLTPLIDMVFILLIFFILAASFAVRGIDLDLPPAHSGQAKSCAPRPVPVSLTPAPPPAAKRHTCSKMRRWNCSPSTSNRHAAAASKRDWRACT